MSKKFYEVRVSNSSYKKGGYTAPCNTLKEARELEAKEKKNGSSVEIIQCEAGQDTQAWNRNL